MSTVTNGEVFPQSPTSANTVDDEFDDCGWIALANCDHDRQLYDTGIPRTTTVNALSRQLTAVERYRAMYNVPMPVHNLMYAFDQYGPDHFRIITDELPTMQASNEETLNSLQAITEMVFWLTPEPPRQSTSLTTTHVLKANMVYSCL